MKNKAFKRSLRQDIAMIVRGYKILYEICPKNMIYRTFYCIICTVMPYFPLFMSAKLIDEIAAGASLNRLLILAGITVLVTLAMQLVQHIAWRKADTLETINWKLNFLYFLKIQCKMQYKHFEDPETALLMEKIRNNENWGGHGLNTLYWNYWYVLSAIVNIITSVSLTVSMLSVAKNVSLSGFLAFVNTYWSALIILALIGINITFQLINVNYFNPRSVKLWEDFSKRFARNNAYYDLASDIVIFKLTRLSILHSHNTFIKTEHLTKDRKLNTKRRIVNLFLQLIMDLALFIYVGAKAFIGVFGIGSFILYRGTVEKFVGAVSTIGGQIGTLRINNDYLEDVFKYIDLPDDMYKGSLSVEKRDDNQFEIEFRNVSFKYPGANDYALKNVSFKFNIGERIAFVGMNGSGKTTFIKLLCRLYDPTEGTILLNGIDISRYKVDEYMALFSVVFQDFAFLGFTLGENISGKEKYDKEKAEECLRRVGFGERLKELERGLDTPYENEYQNDGINFSGGESQKLAIARALYKDSPFIILDEPTAALDPLAEAEIYSHFNTIVDNKTAIFISHRLSSCRFCDNILVFHNGEIIEEGNHDTLILNENGKYYELWNAQAKYYTDGE